MKVKRMRPNEKLWRRIDRNPVYPSFNNPAIPSFHPAAAYLASEFPGSQFARTACLSIPRCAKKF
jgi:hypothetical protein